MNLIDAVNICRKPGDYTRAEVMEAGPILVEHLEGKDADYTALIAESAQWQADVLVEYHYHCEGARSRGVEPMTAHEWASEVLERARQAEGD